jgi:ATP-binding protein involved in chromosome partitioning
MRIAVFQKEGRLLPNCADSAQVAIVEVDQISNSVQQAAWLTPPPQSVGALADWLCREEVEVVLTHGIRRQDRALLEQKGIAVIVGVPAFRVEPAVASYLAGTLQTGTDPCEESTEDCT